MWVGKIALSVTKVKSIAKQASNFIKDNIGIIGAGAGGIALGATMGTAAAAIRSSGKKRKSKVKRRRVRKASYKPRTRRKGRRTPHTAGKGKDRSHKRIRYTKNGQPYVILSSGKAMFISKRRARLSHRRKGGRY